MNFRLVFYSQLSSQRIWSFPGLTFTSSKMCLITIWQTHIQQWYGESDLPQPQPTVKPDSTDNSEHPIVKRGHVLKLIPSGGVFCCRCGRSTKLIKHQRFKILSKVCTFPDLPPGVFCCRCGQSIKPFKHQRLKILSKPCTFPDLPQEQWLTEPGFQNIHSFEAAEQQLNEKHNKGQHRLIWNRLVGKDEQSNFGKLWCSACGQEWLWKSRRANSIRRTCNPIHPLPAPPNWVTLLPHLILIPIVTTHLLMCHLIHHLAFEFVVNNPKQVSQVTVSNQTLSQELLVIPPAARAYHIDAVSVENVCTMRVIARHARLLLQATTTFGTLQAGDLSAVVRGQTQTEVKDKLRAIHAVVRGTSRQDVANSTSISVTHLVMILFKVLCIMSSSIRKISEF